MEIGIFLGLVAGSWIFYQFLRAWHPFVCFCLYGGLLALIVLYYIVKLPLLLAMPRMVFEYMGIIWVSGPLLVPILRLSLGLSLGMSDAAERGANTLSGSPAWRGGKVNKTLGTTRRTLADDLRERGKEKR